LLQFIEDAGLNVLGVYLFQGRGTPRIISKPGPEKTKRDRFDAVMSKQQEISGNQ